MTDGELVAKAKAVVEEWRDVLELQGVPIDVQVGNVAEFARAQGVDSPDEARGFTCCNPEQTEFLIAIGPSADGHEAGFEHIVLHELVHVYTIKMSPVENGSDGINEVAVEQLTHQLERNAALADALAAYRTREQQARALVRKWLAEAKAFGRDSANLDADAKRGVSAHIARLVDCSHDLEAIYAKEAAS